MLQVLINYWKWFLCCFITYFLYGCMVYWEPIKRSGGYFWLGLLIAFIGNCTWLMLGRQSSNPIEILYIGLIWDLAIMMAFTASGICFGAVHPDLKSATGICLIFLGATILKL